MAKDVGGPAPPLDPDQNVYHTRTNFSEKGGFFQWEEWIREIKKMGSFFSRESTKFWKRAKILQAFISICLFRMFELICINVFEL